MASRNAQIAQAVADGLSAAAAVGKFPRPFVAIRRYDPTDRRDGIPSISVSVWASGDVSTRVTRQHNQHVITISVQIARPMTSGLDPATLAPASLAGVNAELDAFMELCEAVADWFRGDCISLPGVGFVTSNFEPKINDPEWLAKNRMMSNVVTASFLYIER